MTDIFKSIFEPKLNKLISDFKESTPEALLYTAVEHDSQSGSVKVMFYIEKNNVITCEVLAKNKNQYIYKFDGIVEIQPLLEVEPLISESLRFLQNNLPDNFKIQPYCILSNLALDDYLAHADFNSETFLYLVKSIHMDDIPVFTKAILAIISQVDLNDPDSIEAIRLLKEESYLNSEELKSIIERHELNLSIHEADEISHGL